MLTHPTLDQLNQLGLFGMAKAFGEVAASGDAAALPHPNWLALLLDREMTYRHDRKLTARLRYARLRHQAAVEDVDYRATRGLDRALFQKLAEGGWIDAHDNRHPERPDRRRQKLACLRARPPGLPRQPIRSLSAHSQALRRSRAGARRRSLCPPPRALGGVQLLILDDWGLEPLDAAARHDLLEILEERHGRRSTIVTSQLPVDKWHDVIGDPTYADAILDRLVHNAHRINLTGDSLRQPRKAANQKD